MSGERLFCRRIERGIDCDCLGARVYKFVLDFLYGYKGVARLGFVIADFRRRHCVIVVVVVCAYKIM